MSDPDFDSLRTTAEFRDALRQRGLQTRVAAVWDELEDVQSSWLNGLTADTHQRRAQQLIADGYRAVVIESTFDGDSKQWRYDSLWHRSVEPPEIRQRREAEVANLAAALVHQNTFSTADEILADRHDRSFRWQLVHKLAQTDAPIERFGNLLKSGVQKGVTRNALLALAEYPSESALRRPDLVDQVRSCAAVEDSGTRAAARWCLRRWSVPESVEDPTPDRAADNAGRLSPRMVVLDPQPFLMGSPTWEINRGETEERHWQAIDRRFAIAETETTVAQFQQFLNDPQVQKYYQDHVEFSYTEKYAPRPDCPQTGVNWFDAALFCQWLSEREGIPEDQWCFPGIWTASSSEFELPADVLERTGYRLPTEAEWEYACRGGSPADYPYGDSPRILDRHAWNLLNSLPPNYRTRPVGQMPPNDFGLHDMIGNVNEWCLEAKQVYRFPFDGYLVADEFEDEDLRPSSVDRVIRGGSFDSIPRELRCADRKQATVAYKRYTMGFRVVRTIAKD